jgi:tetratricopeptide (TPR) repeat protein
VACTPDHDHARLVDARALQASGQLKEAIPILRAILEDDRDHPEANFMLGKALIQIGRPGQAVAPLERATSNGNFARPAGLLLASTLFRTRAYPKAIHAATRVLEIDATNVIALLTRGKSRLASKQPAEALADANRILEIDPNYQNAIMLKGGALINLEQRDEAEQIWINLRTSLTAEGSPGQAARACTQLALFYRTQAEEERADRTYRECLDSYPTVIYLQQSAIDFYLRRGQPERAIEIRRKAVEAAPDDLRLWAGLANVLMRYGELANARRTLEETVERFDSPTAWRLLANFHRRTGDTTQAREALEEAIGRTREPREAHLFSLAELLVEEGDLDRAREIYATLTDLSYRHLLEGAISLQTGDPKQALEHLDAGLTSWPDNPRAHYLAGQAALQLTDLSRASFEFHEAVRIDESATDAAGRLAEIHFASSRFRWAFEFAERQIAQRPYANPTAHHIMIQSAIELGKLERAQEATDALRDIDPDGSAWLFEMAAIKRHEGGAKAASEYILTSGRNLSDSANEPLLQSLTDDLSELDRNDESLAYIDAALEQRPERAVLHDLRARVLAHLERFDEAEIAMQQALQLDPGLVLALETKAFLALRGGDLRAALEAFDAAADAAPRDAQHPYAAASVARSLGDEELTIAHLNRALARRPDFGLAANELAWLLATRGEDLDRAQSLARLAVRRMRSTKAFDTLGWVQHQRGEYEKAVTSFRTILDLDESLLGVQFRLGLALVAIGETEEASQLLRELAEGPKFPEQEQARAEITRIEGS